MKRNETTTVQRIKLCRSADQHNYPTSLILWAEYVFLRSRNNHIVESSAKCILLIQRTILFTNALRHASMALFEDSIKSRSFSLHQRQLLSSTFWEIIPMVIHTFARLSNINFPIGIYLAIAHIQTRRPNYADDEFQFFCLLVRLSGWPVNPFNLHTHAAPNPSFIPIYCIEICLGVSRE